MALNAAVTATVIRDALKKTKVLDALVHQLQTDLPALTFVGTWDSTTVGGANHTDLAAEIQTRFSVA